MMEIDLSGLIDMHLHSAPDVRPRYQDDVGLTRSARDAGLRAILLKSHVTITSDRATIAEKVVPGIRVFGALTMNRQVGGLNPAAVVAAIRLGAREVWMPTTAAAHELGYLRSVGDAVALADSDPGITILQDDGTLVPAVHDILDLIAAAGIILGTGHLSPTEIAALVPAALDHGVRHVIITHPEAGTSNIPLELVLQLKHPSVWCECCYVSTLGTYAVPLALIGKIIRALGPEQVILTTDCGSIKWPPPLDAFRMYLVALQELGIPWPDLRRMASDNPATVLGV